MRLQTFFSVLIAIMALAFAGYFISVKLFFNNPLPDAPCTMEITNGEFINDQFKNYRFNGSITLWLNSNMITIFGIYDTSEGKKQLNRSLLLENVKRQSNVITAYVKTTNIAPGDELHGVGSFFAAKDQSLTFHFEKIKRGEYLVMINNNWVSLCKEH